MHKLVGVNNGRFQVQKSKTEENHPLEYVIHSRPIGRSDGAVTIWAGLRVGGWVHTVLYQTKKKKLCLQKQI